MKKQPTLKKKEIAISPKIEHRFRELIAQQKQLRAQLEQNQKDINISLMILFDSKGVDLPAVIDFEVKEGKLLYADIK